ncbi:MAG: hypothetical protein L0211_06615 [Planctomycetaceae bacterium]|nr:hypothetical protein [Planctomycetaceae bacterium]
MTFTLIRPNGLTNLSRPTQLLERVALAPAGRIDRAAGIIYGVSILGRESSNGRTYSDQAMRDAARLYEGERVRINHPERSDRHQQRRLNEEFGVLRNCRVAGDRVRGDLYYVKSHPDAEWILERIERFPDRIGLSHNADGKATRSLSGHTVVESIARVVSVDIVNEPATTGGIFESHDSDSGPRLPQSAAELAAAMSGKDGFSPHHPREFRARLLEAGDPTYQPQLGKDVADASQEVDSAVAAALDELLPVTTISDLREKGAASIKQAFATLIRMLTDSDRDNATKMRIVRAALAEQERALAAFDDILSPLDRDELMKADLMQKDGEGPPATSMESRQANRLRLAARYGGVALLESSDVRLPASAQELAAQLR